LTEIGFGHYTAVDGRYLWRNQPEFPSQRGNDDYFISCALLPIMGALQFSRSGQYR
jgi:hypothetical protein